MNDFKTYNTGKNISVEKIKDLRKAALDFSEGNQALFRLLINCFSKNIDTIASCKGHQEKSQSPYISLVYSKDNINYLYALLAKTSEKNYKFTYNKINNGKSSMSIDLNDNCDATSFFNELNNILSSYDKNYDYYNDLPLDLKKYALIISVIEKDSEVDISENDLNCFSFSYSKNNENYDYTLYSDNDYYNNLMEKYGFIEYTKPFLFYSLSTLNRNIAYFNLSNIQEELLGISYDDKISDLKEIKEIIEKIDSDSENINLDIDINETKVNILE